MAIEIIRNDITKMDVDAIVNPANNELMAGGGACGAIHDAAGPDLEKECLGLGGCANGEAKITGAYKLPCKYVIHTVGPIWLDGKHGEPETLRNCYLNSLALAKDNGCRSVAFPLISAGIFGYPKDAALHVAYSTIGEFLASNDVDIHVYIVLFDVRAVQIAESVFTKMKKYVDAHYVEETLKKFERRRECNYLKCESPIEELETVDGYAAPADIESQIDMMKNEETFSQKLLKLINASGMTHAQCYAKAFIDRKHFSKIQSQKNYQPTKGTVYSFALALRLTMAQTEDLLERAGFHFSNSILTDVIVRFAISSKLYDVLEVNKLLFSYDQKTL